MPEFDLPFSNESELARRIREAIGAGDFEPIRAHTPQFERLSGDDPWYYPEDAEALEAIKAAPADVLHSMGLRQWDEGHWLYPGEWYDHIPDGYPVVTISGEEERFKRGETDDGIRFGCLAYGFIKKAASS